jgi:hypothetical protein
VYPQVILCLVSRWCGLGDWFLTVVRFSVVTATKFYDDHYYDNLYYSKVGGISLSELNRLEMELLFQIDFTLSVPSSVFATYRAELMRSIPPGPTPMSMSPVKAFTGPGF